MDDPLDDLALGELHGLGDGGREVDVPLLAGLALDELDFGRESRPLSRRSGCVSAEPYPPLRSV